MVLVLAVVAGTAQAAASMPEPLQLQPAAASARSFETLAAAERAASRSPELAPVHETGAFAVPESIALSLAGLGVAGLLSRRWQLQAGA